MKDFFCVNESYIQVWNEGSDKEGEKQSYEKEKIIEDQGITKCNMLSQMGFWSRIFLKK